MPTTTLADNVKEQRDPARAKLQELAGLREQLDGTNSVLTQLMARRRALWNELSAMNPSVSWADLSRVSGVTSVTIHQTVKGRKAKDFPTRH